MYAYAVLLFTAEFRFLEAGSMTAIIVSRFLLIAGVTHLAASVSLISYEDFSKFFIYITLAYRRIW